MGTSARGVAERSRTAAAGLAVAALAAGLYFPVLGHGFLNYDDDVYVTANPHVRAGLTAESVGWALTRPQSGNYHPLTMLSHLADVELYGLDPRGHHATSVALHALNAVLLFAFLHALTGRPVPAALVAGLFAAHPLGVQSVAWIAERKNVLSTAFWLAGLLAYVAYLRRPGRARLAGVTALGALALLAKPMAVTYPLTLWLVDLAVHGGFTRPLAALPPRRAVVEKVPLLAASFLAGLATLWAQSAEGAMPSAAHYPLGTRLAHAASAYVWYLERAVAPHGLAAFYPYPDAIVPARTVTAVTVLAAITVAVVWGRRRVPLLAFGWTWYVVTLAPVAGIVQVGVQAWADRYAYVPLVGIFVAIVGGADATLGRLGTRARAVRVAAVAAGLAAVVTLAARTRAEIPHWRDSVALFSRAVAVTAPNPIAYDNLGMGLVARGDMPRALDAFRAAVAAGPASAASHMNLANALAVTGDRDAALEHYERAARLAPGDPRIPANAGRMLLDAGRPALAIPWLERAAALDPDLAGLEVTLARALAASGRREEALRRLEAAAARAPDPAARAAIEDALRKLRPGR